MVLFFIFLSLPLIFLSFWFMCFLIFLSFLAWLEYSEAAIDRRMRDFDPQSLANTAWAFATSGHQEEQLFTALAVATEWHIRDFNEQALANTSWAFAMVG